MKIDLTGTKFIANEEGLVLTAYQCSAGVWTIGLGSTYYANGKKVQKGDKLPSIAAAYELFALTVQNYEVAVNNGVKVPLNQNQFNALLSLVYNIGVAGFLSSTVLKRINAKASFDDVAEAWRRWNKVKGVENAVLKARRNRELKLYAA
ncbi:lysozyme [Pedobacter sp. SL55]|uniref:lysozyme n=1 Tax=Pedobacter sp. SL55 TaxID=2995161 RepID=UPI0022704301|nr:lysozyme [Pedobacter sp. SL55]WAC40579.1 lysozyme [Pedobacter sp. SL55]